MEMNVDTITISDAAVQTDLVNSPIILQCLYVLQTVPEFQNLTYRVTKSQNDVEMVVVYREGILGIFGPPIDPFTLTLDPNGKCLLSIPFKPVQRVSIISAESGCIEINSLLAVLRMIAGNGYLFCPGLPERFLAGKACGKFVVLHKVPFKRYQSSQCPVYYKTQALQEKSTKSSLCVMCPRCLQAAKCIHSLPVMAPNGAGKAPQLAVAGHLQPDQKNCSLSTSVGSTIIEQEGKDTTSSVSANRFLSLSNLNNSLVTSLPTAPERPNIYFKDSIFNQKASNVDLNGNNQATDVLKNSNLISDQISCTEDNKTSVNTKILEKINFLRNLLQERSKEKKMCSTDLNTDAKDGKTTNDAAKQLDSVLNKGKRKHKNICRHCKKEFSTPANLMNHFQRHEALSGSWYKQIRERKLLRNHTSSSSLLKMVIRRTKLSSILQGKKPARLSETSLRLFLKYFDDMIPSQNEEKSLQQQRYNTADYKNAVSEAEKWIRHDRPKSLHNEQTENEALEKKSGHKRTLSGLSPMQTLLEAAIAGSPTISSSSSFNLGKHTETAVVSSTSQSPTIESELKGTSFPEKKPRKSTRLASKRAKRRRYEDNQNETVNKSVATPENSSMLTNLNLLSTVSIERAERGTSTNTHNSENLSCSTSPTTNIRASPALSASDYVSNPQQFFKNPTENGFLNNRSQGKEPVTSVSSSGDHYLQPLLFASSMVQGTNLVHSFPSQKQQDKSKSDTVTLSSQRNHVTVGNSHPPVSPSLVMAAKSEACSNNDCGAIDLSKPKPQTTANIPLFVEKTSNLTAHSGSSHNFAQFITNNDNTEVLHNLMRMTKAVNFSNLGHKDSQLGSAVTNNKQVESDLQASLFPYARNYKTEKDVKSTIQAQTVIAASSSAVQGNVKSGGSLSMHQSDEIQCGYKWTGSGGLVKERTQMVRELVPQHIMANFFSKPLATTTQPIGVSFPDMPKSQLLTPKHVLSSMSVQSAASKSQNMSVSTNAQNLTPNQLAEMSALNKMPGVSRKSSTHVTTSPSPVGNSSSCSTGLGMYKSSLTNTSGTVNQLTASSPKMRYKAIHMSQTSGYSPSVLSTVPTISSSISISSPSLAAILLQPATTVHEINHSGFVNHNGFVNSATQSVTSSTLFPNHSNTVPSSLHYSPTCSYIKTEPADSHNTEQNMTMETVPIKVEIDINSVDRARSFDDSSPKRLVVNVSPEIITSKDIVKTLNLGAHPISRTGDLASKNISIKCDL
uniref:C2H2-type domain-containing protein n=1 Tax=Arion vulgaris TaxID=1028688 RepID=A0A0B7ARR7_9EUPU